MATETDVQMPPRRSRAPLVALLGAEGISQTGNWLTMLAVPWFVLEATGSATRTGVTAAVATLAIVVAGLLGGAFVDRLGPKRTSGSPRCSGRWPHRAPARRRSTPWAESAGASLDCAAHDRDIPHRRFGAGG